jgi:undecaprenyl-diphosphatase
MGLENVPVLFDVMLHMATLVVVIFFFRKRISDILRSIFRWAVRKADESDRPNLVLTLQLLAASFLTAVIGLGISSLEINEKPGVVSLLMIVTAVILLVSMLGRPETDIYSMGWGRSLLIGAAQGLGVFPGISRSGITIGSGLLLGVDRKSAGEFSFLLSIPAISGAFLLSVKDATGLSSSVPAVSLISGLAAAVAAGYFSLRLLMWIISGGKFWYFSFYLVPAGILGIIYFGI